MKRVGHEFDADVKTSRVDRGYTDYSQEYILQEINKIDYELQLIYKIGDFRKKQGKTLPNHFPNITKREKFCEFLPFCWLIVTK